mmetsp:Transcript_26061/g.65694  ORF Transcript_26061/g.65694 Transcript_26061/m.65694 type:complete len:471 (-) Transcript_26061:1130-2542(-)
MTTSLVMILGLAVETVCPLVRAVLVVVVQVVAKLVERVLRPSRGPVSAAMIPVLLEGRLLRDRVLVPRPGHLPRHLGHVCVFGHFDRVQEVGGDVAGAAFSGSGVVVNVSLHHRKLQQDVHRGSLPRVHLEEQGDHFVDVAAVDGWHPRILPPQDLSVQRLHVVRAKRGPQRDHFVDDAAQGPHVGLGVVGHVPPHLGTGVVGRPRLRHAETPLRHLGDVQIAQLDLTLAAEEDVRALQVPVQNLQLVQSLQPVTHAKGAVPDVGLAEEGAHLLVVADFLKQIPTVSILRDNAQTPACVVVEALLVSDDVLVLDTGQQPHLVQRVLFFLFAQVWEFHLFQGVDLVIGEAQDFVHRTVGALAEQRHLPEVLQRSRHRPAGQPLLQLADNLLVRNTDGRLVLRLARGRGLGASSSSLGLEFYWRPLDVFVHQAVSAARRSCRPRGFHNERGRGSLAPLHDLARCGTRGRGGR